MNQIQPWGGSASPFDAMRRYTVDGAEFWSARELMPLLGYSTWERFDDAIERAVIAARNSGATPSDHFRGAAKVIEGGRWGEQTVNDHHLTRYACYLVAMNGDPRKPEIAAAQTYFAIKTREAETRPAALEIPRTYAEALRAAADAVERAELAEAKVSELEPSANAWDVLANAAGDYSLREAAQILSRDPLISIGQNQLNTYLKDEAGWVDRRGEPYQAQVNNGRLVRRTRSYEHPHTGEPKLDWQVRITVKGLRELHKRLGGFGAEGGLVGAAA